MEPEQESQRGRESAGRQHALSRDIAHRMLSIGFFVLGQLLTGELPMLCKSKRPLPRCCVHDIPRGPVCHLYDGV